MHDGNVLIYGDSRSYSLRHEVPLPFPDPVAYLEVGGKRWVLAGAVDIAPDKPRRESRLRRRVV